MAWVALIAALLLFAAVLAAFLWLLFLPQVPGPTWIPGAIDLILGFCLRQVYVFLFPSPTKPASRPNKPTKPAKPR